MGESSSRSISTAAALPPCIHSPIRLNVTNDGYNPYGSLVLVGSTLYGMTYNGGANGYGVIFKINTDGSQYAILHSFGDPTVNNNQDGQSPNGSLVASLSGTTLYGMTSGGGVGNGVIFQISTNGAGYAILHSFGDGSVTNDGANPFGDLTLSPSGAVLYGMTLYGGAAAGNGAVFQINTSGSNCTILHSFGDGSVPSDGVNPEGSLVLSGSILYGMASSLAATGDRELSSGSTPPPGRRALLYSFGSDILTNDGSYPYGSLVLAGSTLYGMTNGGGSNYAGTIFRINTDGTSYDILHSFGDPSVTYNGTSNADGTEPYYGALMLSGSTLYGMTYGGGEYGTGTIFSETISNTVPDPPTNVQAAPGNAQAAVSFTPPANNGGAAIFTYTVLASDGITTTSGTSSPIIVPGLTNGQSYTFTVTATNIVGTGLPGGPSNSVTPSATCLSYLAGTWNLSDLVTGPSAPFWERDVMTINADGTFSNSGVNNSGDPQTVTGNLWVFPYGMWMNIVPSTPFTVDIPICQVSMNDTVFSCSATQSDGSTDLIVATLQGSSYSMFDLAAEWEGVYLDSGPINSTTNPAWEQLNDLPIDIDGNLQATTLDSNSNSNTTSGQYALSGTTGDLTCVSGSCPDPNFQSFMDAGKTVMAGTYGGSSQNMNAWLTLYAKTATSYTPLDLAGTWTANVLVPSSNAPSWYRISANIDVYGTVSATVTQQGKTAVPESMQMALSAAGAVICYYGACLDPEFSMFMDESKTVMLETGTDLVGVWTKTQAGQGGSLTVTISPPDAVSAGAQWSIDGYTWQAGGATMYLSPGPYTVYFNSATGWTTPASQQITVTNNQNTPVATTYAQQGTLTVTITPADAVSAGAQWSIDGGIPGIQAGPPDQPGRQYLYGNLLPATGWTPPGSQQVTVTARPGPPAFAPTSGRPAPFW